MRLRALDIQQLPGTGAFALRDLAAGANLITGPNAVGKSSLIRALRYLIGGARAGDPSALALSAELDEGAVRWQVRRAGSQVVWTRDGQAADPPALPDPDLLHCYWLRVEDLLSADGQDDAALVRQLRSELSGGFDLDALRASAPFDFGPQTGHKEARALQEARRARREVENTQEALRHEAERLPSMRSEAEAAEQAGRRLDRLDRALALLEARRARREAEQRLEPFPAGMDRLRGNELARLSEIETEREGNLQAREEQERARREAAERLAQTGLSGDRPASAELQAQHDHLALRTRLADRLEEERKRVGEARAQEKRAARSLGATRAFPRLDPESVERAGTVAGRQHEARRARDDLRARLDTLDYPSTAVDRERVSGHGLWIAALAFLGGLGAGTAAALLPAPWWRLAAAAFLAGAGFWGLAEAVRRWSERRAEADFRARRRRELESELQQTQDRLDACEQERRTFCAEHGLDPALFDGAALERFVRLAADLDRSRDARYAAEQAVADTEVRIAEQDRCVHDFLARWEAAPETAEGAELQAALTAFEQRCHEAARAQDEQRRAEREIGQLARALGRCDERSAQLYAEAGLGAGARAELEARCAAYESWQQARQAYEHAAHVESERRQRLDDAPDLLARADADAEGELQAERDRVARQAEDRDRRRDAVRDLERRLQQAGQEHELEDAAAAEERAREALADQYDQAMLAAAGHFLLDSVAAEYRSEHEPALLQDARERFARFTHHACSLEVDPEHGFHAVDQASEQSRGLGELSSGTRMQLLLAVRMAWARQIEREKVPLPLFLDEALTTSDESRFCEVAASLQRLVEDEERQVFYLSARRQEAALWERATGQSPHVVDLAEARFGRTAAEAEDYALPPADSVPEPGQRTPEEYAAALGVPPVDPRQPITGLHVFHLLRDDLTLLHALMEHWRVRQLGALEALLRSEAAASAVPDAAQRARLAARCRGARHWAALWRQGRGIPVDRGSLEQSGHVSERFIDRVAELADTLGGDAAALIEALRAGRVPRFRTQNTDELAEWLRVHGHIATTEPLDAAERERRTLQASGAHGDPADLRALIGWLETAAVSTAGTRVPVSTQRQPA